MAEKYPARYDHHFIDLTHQTFERWIVVCRAPSKKNTAWLCFCLCGNSGVIEGVRLKDGGSKSCGCLQRELASARHTKHGHKRKRASRTYGTWQAMIRRCYDPKHKYFKLYGGRGITICDRWNREKGGTFKNFLVDMGERPIGKTIDRWPNKNGNYEPGNCRWATHKEQCNNQKTNHLVIYNGENLTISQLAEKTGARIHVLYRRISQKGWSVEKALSTPIRKPPSFRSPTRARNNIGTE